jgi:hypothetical protein
LHCPPSAAAGGARWSPPLTVRLRLCGSGFLCHGCGMRRQKAFPDMSAAVCVDGCSDTRCTSGNNETSFSIKPGTGHRRTNSPSSGAFTAAPFHKGSVDAQGAGSCRENGGLCTPGHGGGTGGRQGSNDRGRMHSKKQNWKQCKSSRGLNVDKAQGKTCHDEGSNASEGGTTQGLSRERGTHSFTRRSAAASPSSRAARAVHASCCGHEKLLGEELAHGQRDASSTRSMALNPPSA